MDEDRQVFNLITWYILSTGVVLFLVWAYVSSVCCVESGAKLHIPAVKKKSKKYFQ